MERKLTFYSPDSTQLDSAAEFARVTQNVITADIGYDDEYIDSIKKERTQITTTWRDKSFVSRKLNQAA